MKLEEKFNVMAVAFDRDHMQRAPMTLGEMHRLAALLSRVDREAREECARESEIHRGWCTEQAIKTEGVERCLWLSSQAACEAITGRLRSTITNATGGQDAAS